MKVYITKYALTKGIFEAEAKQDNKSMICIIGGSFDKQHFYGRDWHDNKDSAIRRAEEMRIKKITSLEKHLYDLKNMKFDN